LRYLFVPPTWALLGTWTWLPLRVGRREKYWKSSMEYHWTSYSFRQGNHHIIQRKRGFLTTTREVEEEKYWSYSLLVFLTGTSILCLLLQLSIIFLYLMAGWPIFLLHSMLILHVSWFSWFPNTLLYTCSLSLHCCAGKQLLQVRFEFILCSLKGERKFWIDLAE